MSEETLTKLKIYKDWYNTMADEFEKEEVDYILELEQRIDKAIEYIKQHSNCSGYFENGKMIIDNIESINGGYELLEILGGDSDGM